MANKPITIYRIQYAFNPRGVWRDGRGLFYSLDEAKESMRCQVDNAKAVLEIGLNWARYWRLMKYELIQNEIVEQTEIKEKTNG